MSPEAIAQSVRTAANDVFSTMLGMELEAGSEFIDTTPPRATDGLMGMVGLAGPWTGVGTISCSAAFACRICNQLLMTEANSVDEEVLDAVGEVTNMVIGSFKTAAEEFLGPLALSVPTVVYGRNFTSRSLGANQWVVLPFHYGGEVMEIRVCLFPSHEAAVPRGGFSHASAVLV
jgi:chemotaxis protein CheX